MVDYKPILNRLKNIPWKGIYGNLIPVFHTLILQIIHDPDWLKAQPGSEERTGDILNCFPGDDFL